MKQRPSNAALLAWAGGAAAILAGGLFVGAGAFAQESLLPPGFGTQPGPSNRPQQVGTPAPGQPVTPPAAPAAAPTLSVDPSVFAAAAPPPPPPRAAAAELPDSARRAIDMVGPMAGLGSAAWGNSDGRFLSILMRRLDVPLTSRWAAITLRRALLGRVPTPAHVAAPDWVAERAWLLLRMGEADGARLLVQGVDVDRFNAKLYAVAGQTALATADPAGLCPLADGGAIRSKEPIWPMARAICASFSGDTAIAGVLMDQARRQTRDPRGIDIQLAERLMGVNGGGQRQVNIEWTGVNQLTSWRFGMASALGITIPSDVMHTVGPQVAAWMARAPMVPATDRIEAAMIAARLGVFSNSALVDLFSGVADEAEDFTTDSPAGKLRACYTASDDAARVAAMRGFWTGASLPDIKSADRYTGLILTARAAARIRPDSEHGDDAAALIGAMMTAGLDRKANGWAPVVNGLSGAKGDDAWAILAVGAPVPSVDLTADRVAGIADRWSADHGQKLRLLLAGLAGLERLQGDQAGKLLAANGVRADTHSNWARLLMAAADRREPGTVALLVAVGMQRNGWSSIRPDMFFTMIRALHDAGLDGEARMIAAEAMTRL